MDTTSFSAEDLKLLAYMLEDEGVDLIQTQAIPRREQTAELPLAFAQERLWFLSHLEPNSPAYNIPVALRLRGQLDVAALQRSFTALVQRHEVLRTNVAVYQGQPIQTLATVGDVPLPILDLSHLSPDAREAEAKRYAEAEAHRPFDLAHDLLIRTTLLQLDHQEHVLVITQHHIVSDGWSTGVMVREIETFYTAYRSGQMPQLPELPIQYADYAAWQRQWLQDERLADELAYWTATLAGAPTVLALPTDRPRPAIKTYAGAIHRFSLPVALSESLIRLSRQEQVTLFTTVLAAFQVLLYRYTRQTDLVVGTPVANRSQAEIQPLIGLFVNTLALRTDLSGNPTFRELLQRSHDVVLGSYAHQDLPFEKVVEVIQPERDLSYTPVFQVLFQLDEAPPETMRVPQLSMEYIEFERVAAKFDLSLAAVNTAQGLSATIEYSSDLFQPATIARMAGHFEMLVSGIIAAPDCPILDLPMLTGAERSDILGAWDGASYLQNGCLHERFEAQAARTPDAIAVVYAASDAPAERLTYAELNQRANQLAHHLQTLGVGPDTLVGLYVERSLDLAIGLLGILKAGGAYLPLDPSYPAERLAATLDDAEVTVLVTQSRLATELSRSVPHTVCLDRANLFAAADTENPASGASVDSLAYVIYTSGSTGKPKGVLVTHANVTRLFDATHDWYGFDERDVWTLFHSAAFDFSVWEFWGALLYGGRLVIVPYLVSRSPEALYELLAAEQVTVLNQTPSAFRQLIWAEQQAAERRSLALRYVIFGGEALDLQSLRPWFELHGDQQPQLVNMYGITETTVHVTYRPITLADLDSAPGSVIGRPIPDLQLYVLDQRRQLVPLGVPGELYVGGAGVARGYLNRPELTAERFVADPFQPHTGARLYKTGDLARQLPGGDLQYLGRIDHQVKIRGFRIELGEIEAAISAHPAVRETVVVAREERAAGGNHAETGGLRLVAYVVAAVGSAGEGTDAPMSAAALRQFLQTTLPDHMLPSAWVFLDALPLTPTGKLDRRALPAPEQQAAETAETYVAPRTPVEQALADIWAEVLHRERVGIHDNFFMLGGDSILSVRLLALAKERGLSLSLQDLFRYQTIGALSRHIQPSEDQLDAAPRTTPFSLVADADRPKLPPDVEDAYPLTRLQAGMIYHMELGADVADYHNVTSFYLHGAIDLDLLRAAAQQIVARHPVLRTSFDLVTYSEPLQLVHAAATMEIQQHDICLLTEAEQVEHLQAYIQAELRRHFDLAQPPLLRLHLHRRTAATFQLTITEFHPILDGWSLNTVLAEIFAVYFALADQQPLTLPPLQSTFRDFVALERQTLDSEACRRYWADKLEDATLLQLPRWPHVERTARQIGSVRLPIASALTTSLQQVAAQASVPLKTILLAAHLRVMHLLDPQANVLTGLVLHGRSEAQDGEKVSGLFLNTLPLRLQPTSGTWRDLIRETFTAELELVDIRRYPLAALQQQWGREQPLFEVLFNFTNFHVLDDLVQSRRLELLPSTIEGLTSSNIPLQVAFGFTSGSAQLELMLDYHTSILCAEQAQQISEYYLAALTALSRDPQSRYETVDLLSQREKDELLVVRNATTAAYPELTYPALFAQQVARTPDAIAVQADDGQFSYQELADAAAQLAQVLRQEYGVERGSRVALLLPRSRELLVALLAVWQAGGAWVPLDAAFPPARIQFVLHDAGAALVLSHTALREHLPAATPPVLWLDQSHAQRASASTTPPAITLTPEDLAYLIYTSGSTGQPKGVLVPQRGLVNYLHWCVTAYTATAGSGAPVQSSIAADAIFPSLFAPLLVGRTVQLLPDAEPLDALAEALLTADPFSLIKITPTQLDVLSHTLTPAHMAGRVQTLVVGAEALRGEQVARWQQAAPHTVILNEYGPTETVVGCSIYHVAQAWSGPVPIGLPIANTTFYVLDAQMQPVPIGVEGELYIGGDGVAWGYHHRPALTAARFVPDPFSNRAGARLYKTGDVVRWLADRAANIVFVGRRDEQVKIRGYRVELAEVERALLDTGAVLDVAVVARDDGHDGALRLVAYVVPATATLRVEELRAALGRRLPDYMVPQAVVVLERLPLTATGKLDRRALPAPDGHRPELAAAYVAPRTAVETTLAGMWQEVLRLDQLGIHDNFFALGGHSLLAIQVIARARQMFGIELPMRKLFDAPTIAQFAEAVTTIQRQAQAIELPPLLPAARTHPLPLSFAQQRLWFLDQLQPNSAVYTIPTAIRLTGSLDQAALERSLQTIVARHESLRTTFVLHGEEPIQVIASELPVSLDLWDLQTLPPEAREASALQVIHEQAQQPFDLTSGPLFRATLFRLSDHEHVLLLRLHHIVSDGWSQDVLFRELSQLYTAYIADAAQPDPLGPEGTPLPIQYADYAVWQRSWLRDAVLESQLAYWKQQLSDLSILQFPTDQPRPPVATFRGAYQKFEIAPATTAALRALSRESGATLFMTLLAGWQSLLARYSGQDDIAVGTPIAGRTQRETEGVIGFFVNTLVLRTDLRGNPSFRALLQRVREVCLQAYMHQDIPFEHLVEELHPTRDLSRNPLFQVMFMLQNRALETVTLPGVTIQPLPIENVTAKFDLDLGLIEEDDRLVGTLVYNPDLFAETTIARLLGHFQALLTVLAADPDRCPAQVPLLTAAEQAQIVVEWNATECFYPRDQLVHQLFEAQVARTPDAIALVAESQQLSYAELNQRANQLARQLQRRGVGPDQVVALCMERSPELVIGLLGVLKAGGAYLPLDPSYPAERLRFMLQDSGARLLLASTGTIDRVASDGIAALCLDRDWPLVAAEAGTGLPPVATPDHLAYVIYTSGSTGKPKGTMIQHRGVVNYLVWAVEAYQAAAGQGAPVHSSLAFDLTMTALFPPLLVGRAAHLLPEGLNVETLSAALRDNRDFSLIKITPAHLEILNHTLAPSEAAGRTRRFVIGGENLLAENIRFWQHHAPDTVLINEYGPTETVVGCCVYEVPPGVQHPASVPIGKPIANTQLYILDRYGQPVPIGVVGELYIGGAGVARGYLNRPALTAEKFVPDAFSAEPGARLYRSGDLSRYLPDGTIEFLGRTDDQVKIRGYRIELGEIEAALQQHEAVRDAAVIAREDTPGQKRLVAYVVEEPRTKNLEPNESQAGDPLGSGFSVLGSALREFLAARLPDYMIPAAFVPLDELPLTVNGKLDRKALPAPATAHEEARRTYVPATDAVDMLLVELWEAMLSVRPIGITDNFFDLGGNSLLAVRLMTQINKRIGQVLPLTTIFEQPTIGQLGVALRERGWPGVLRLVDKLAPIQSPLVEIQPRGTRRPFFFVASLGGVLPANMLSGFMDLVPYFHPEQPYYGLQVPGLAEQLVALIDPDHLPDGRAFLDWLGQGRSSQQIIEDAAASCVQAIRSVQPQGPYLLGGFCTGGAVAFEIAQQLIAQGEQVGLLALIDTEAASLGALLFDPADHEAAQRVEQRIADVLAAIEQPDPKVVAWFISRDLGNARLSRSLEEVQADLQRLDRSQWWEYAVEHLKHADVVVQDAEPQEVQRLFMIYQINTISLNYILGQYLPRLYRERITVLRVSDMHGVDVDPALGWAELSTQPVIDHAIPGDHGTLFHEPHIQVLAQLLTRSFDEVE